MSIRASLVATLVSISVLGFVGSAAACGGDKDKPTEDPSVLCGGDKDKPTEDPSVLCGGEDHGPSDENPSVL